ncbi:MAG: glycosyltransferase [Planctomycetota bacterium]|jgi:glycosyltransferase involved in cell wall biosynthesis
MNILHLSTNDVGGAGKAAYRLHRNLLALGLNSKMMVMARNAKNSDVIPFGGHRSVFKIKSDIAKYFLRMRTDPKYYFQNHSRSPIKRVSDVYGKVPFKPDIIVAHWISNFVSTENLYQLSSYAGVPVVWYLMDMAPFTGGCHYAWECTGFMNQCGKCPALYSDEKYDLSYRNWKKKYDVIQKMNITIVSATGWLTKQAKKTTVFNGKRIKQIMLGVDAEIFKSMPRDVARTRLNLPLKQKIVLFGAQSLKLKRKGMFHLIEALKSLEKQLGTDKNKILIVTAGDISGIRAFLINNFHHKHLGFLTNDRILATAYQAADVFVCPSIEDSGPMMINESIMCGTPVVCFEMGVAPDLVHTEKTGYCAQLKNSEDLAKGIKYVLDLSLDKASNISKQCSSLGLQFCHHKVQAGAFKKLFESLVGDNCH